MSAMRNTIQRQVVLQTVRTMCDHPTAEDIYCEIHHTHPSISRGTVYRNLARLAEEGEIRRVAHLNAADRFDFALHPHYHFRCTACNKVFDVDLPYKHELIEEVPNQQGLDIRGCEITFTGLCPVCNRQGEEQD